MIEVDWLYTSTLPKAMLRQIRGRVSPRKLHLLGCAACRQQPEVRSHDLAMQAITAVEEFSDGLMTPDDYFAIRNRALRAYHAGWVDPQLGNAVRLIESAIVGLMASDAFEGVLQAVDSILGLATEPPSSRARRERLSLVRASICNSIREVVGNPFRTWQVMPAFLGGGLIQPDNTTIRLSATARDLAANIAALQAFDRLPILADALEESGVTDAGMLAHCRDAQPHTRGCWVLDLLLGRT